MAAHARKAVVTALLAAGCTCYDLASAATLPTGATLSITAGSVKPTKGTYSGSYFGMDSNNDTLLPLTDLTAINGSSYFSGGATCNSTILSGLISSAAPLPIGSAVTASGSHTGCPDGTSERPAADIWVYFGNTGMNYLATAATDNGNGTLAWSGWTVTWNGIAAIPMNARAWQPGNCDDLWLNCTGWTFTDSAARFQWNGTAGGAYTLDYTATVPDGDPSGFGGVPYYLHLVGTVTLPAFTLVPDSASTTTNTAKTIDVTANDSPSGYSIDANSAAIATNPSNGTLTLGAAGSSASGTNKVITYTPTTGFTGTDSFTYTVTGNSGITSSAATVSVTVTAVLPPTANADTATTSGTSATTISVLSNDTAGANAISASTVAISTAASHGTATANSSGTVTYTATSGFSGTDTFQYTVRDTAANISNAATVSVAVRATAPASSSGTLSPGTTATAAGGTPATTGGGLTTSNVGADSGLSQQCVGGCFDFSISGLSAGSSVKVVLPLSATIPANAVYRKKSASGTWGDFSSASGNAIASAAPISAGVCPEAGSSSYTSGLTVGNQCVQLTIVEGGANDADSVTTTISDPSGVGVKGTPADLRTSATGGCSLGSSRASLTDRGEWWLVLGFVAWLGMVIRRRQSRA